MLERDCSERELAEMFPKEKSLASAFLTGLLMGMAAPALILTNTTPRAAPSISDALAGDWQRVGADMRAATQRIARRTGVDKRAA